MPKFLNISQIVKTQGGFGFFASGSTAFQATSSQASTPAQLDITISSSLPTNIISNTTLMDNILIPGAKVIEQQELTRI